LYSTAKRVAVAMPTATSRPNSEKFKNIACRMLTGKFEVPQNEKVMVTLTKCPYCLVSIALSFRVFRH